MINPKKKTKGSILNEYTTRECSSFAALSGYPLYKINVFPHRLCISVSSINRYCNISSKLGNSP